MGQLQDLIKTYGKCPRSGTSAPTGFYPIVWTDKWLFMMSKYSPTLCPYLHVPNKLSDQSELLLNKPFLRKHWKMDELEVEDILHRLGNSSPACSGTVEIDCCGTQRIMEQLGNKIGTGCSYLNHQRRWLLKPGTEWNGTDYSIPFFSGFFALKPYSHSLNPKNFNLGIPNPKSKLFS